jgi:hypothetical protein
LPASFLLGTCRGDGDQDETGARNDVGEFH